MKYAMVWVSRVSGSGRENEDAVRRGLEILGQVVRDYLALRPPVQEPAANWTPLV